MTNQEFDNLMKRRMRQEAIDDWVGFALTAISILGIGAMAFWALIAPDGLAVLVSHLIAG